MTAKSNKVRLRGQKKELLASLVLLGPVLFLQSINGLYVDILISQSPILFWIADLITFALVPLGLFFLVVKTFEIELEFFGLSNPIAQLGLFRFIIFAGISVAVYLFVTYLVGRLVWQSLSEYSSGEGEGYSAAIPTGLFGSIASSIYFSLSAAVVETVVYTGVAFGLYKSLAKPQFLLLPFAIVSGLLFGIVHWENGLNEVVTNSILGGVAFLLLNWWGNIWPLVVGHFVVLMVIFV